MKKHLILVNLIFLFSFILKSQNLDFSAPDTVCVGQQINIVNNSSGWQTYKWNFCKGEPSQAVVGVNLGNPSSSFDRPDFLQVVKDGSNYVGFVSNDKQINIGYVSRVNFGTSIENTPTVENLGDFGGKLNSPTNLKLIKEGNNWYCFYLNSGLLTSDYRLVRLDFGNSLLNTPTLTDFGNIGGFLSYPLEIDIIKTNGKFIGFITNLNNTLQRIEFGSNLTSTPNISNLGNVGNLSRPTNFKFVNSIGKWYMFLVNDNNNSITRLDFGNSLLNTPIGKNLGNPQGKLNRPLDIIPFFECGDFSALVANGTDNQLLRVEFVDGIESINLNATNLGNIGGLSYPGAFSNLLYDNGTKYTFVANTGGNTLSRLKFSPCIPLGQPSSTQFSPPAFSLNDTGRFLVQLIVDEGLPSESQICKQVVVIETIKKPDARINPINCSTDSIRLTITNIDPTTSYSWIGPNGFASTQPNVSIKYNGSNSQNGNYIVTGSGRCGVKKDTVNVNVSCSDLVTNFISPDTICINEFLKIQNLSTNVQTSLWSFCKNETEVYNSSFVDLGNLTGNFDIVNNHDIVFDGTNYIQIITNYNSSPNNVYLANYGSNVKNNTPQLKNLTSFLSLANGLRPTAIQIEKDNDSWFCFILYDGAQPKFLRLNFGNSLLNDPIVYNLGNFGIVNFLSYDFELVKDGNGNFHGFFSGIGGNGIRHLNFGNKLSNTPTHNNLGTFGVIGDMCTMKFKKVENNWIAFVSNTGNSTTKPNTIFMLNFGTDLNNINPSVFELGDFGTQWPHVALFFQECGIPKAYFVDGLGNDLFEMTFPNGYLVNNFSVRNLGNVGNFNQTGQFSDFFITPSNEKISFWAGGYNNSIIRQSFNICNSAGLPNLFDFQPDSIQFLETGVYNIIYTANIGQSNEDAFCKSIVVISKPDPIKLGNDTTYCGNFTRVLNTGIPNTLWSTGQIGSSITVNKAGIYWAQVSNRCGTTRDSIIIRDNCSSCDSWLFTQANPSSVKVGDLDITGNKITVECVFNGLPNSSFHLVTKHTGMQDINYALSVNGAEIKTANDGYVRVDVACETSPNETYHVAMVYDGASLKFYKDGYLLKEVPCSGNLRNNNILTTIGNIDERNGNYPNEQFIGYINEVRIWNKVRTQAEIRQFMDATLPNPTTQAGLKGYYVFNDLTNKQGNSAFNGTLVGSAMINQTNPQCEFIPDSCIQVCEPTIRGDLNICKGDSTILSIFGIYDSVRWSNNDTTRSIIVTQPGQYAVTTYLGTCIGMDTVTVVEIHVPKPTISGNSEFCIGDSTLLTVNGIYDSIKWNNGIIGNQIFVSSVGEYIAIAYLNGCSASDTINITVLALPIPINLGNDTLLCDDFPKILITGNPSTIWSTGELGQSISVSEEGTYWAEITETCGSVRDSITLAFENCDCNVFVPNTFSPNNDKENDIFYPRTECPINNIMFRVFDRWGEKVFESNDINIGWDGTFKGKDAIVDSYSFTLNYNIVRDGSAKFIKGKIVLIR